jgi:hypothetical protein
LAAAVIIIIHRPLSARAEDSASATHFFVSLVSATLLGVLRRRAFGHRRLILRLHGHFEAQAVDVAIAVEVATQRRGTLLRLLFDLCAQVVRDSHEDHGDGSLDFLGRDRRGDCKQRGGKDGARKVRVHLLAPGGGGRLDYAPNTRETRRDGRWKCDEAEKTRISAREGPVF